MKDLLVEKNLIDAALERLKTNFQNLIGPVSKTGMLVNRNAVKEFGEKADADTILTISVTETKDLITIIADLVDTNTGEISKVAAEEVKKNK